MVLTGRCQPDDDSMTARPIGSGGGHGGKAVLAGQRDQFTIGKTGNCPPCLMMLMSPICTPCSRCA